MHNSPSKDLMWRSCCFRLIFAATLGLVFSGIILGIVANSATCNHHSYSTCSSYFYYSTNECRMYDTTYCCGSYIDGNMYYSSCGGYNYCYLKPQEQESKCEGLSIVATCFMGLALLSLFVLLASICHFRRKAGQAELKPYYQPLVFSSQEEWQRYLYLNTFHRSMKPSPSPLENPPLPLREQGDRHLNRLGSKENKVDTS